MGTKYSSKSISGYNATPPDDDGTVSEANKVKWSTVKTKLGDTIKTLAEAINTALVTHFDNGPTAITSSDTLDATHYGQTIEASGSGVTLTLSDAATLTAGWHCEIINKDTTNAITLARATASDTINDVSADLTILPAQTIRAIVNAAATGFLVPKPNGWTKFAQGASVASAATCDVWATADGKTAHITGSTGPITSFGTASQAGLEMWAIFDSTPTITAGANLVLNNGGASVTIEAGDCAHIYADTTTKAIVTIFRASGFPIPGKSPVLLASGSLSAAATAPIVLTAYTAYRNKQIKLINWRPQTNNQALNIRFSSDGGSSYDQGASDYRYSIETLYDSAGVISEQSAAASAIQLTNQSTSGVGNGTTDGVEGWINLFNTTSTARYTRCTWSLPYIAGGAILRSEGVGFRVAAQDTDAVTLYFASGNIQEGEYQVWGWT